MIDRAFFTLQENKARRFLLIFKRGEWAKVLVIFVYLLIFLFLALGVFLFSLTSFRFLGQYPDVDQPIIIYTLAITFILTSILTFTSSIITGLGALFQKEDNSLLFSLPIKTATIFESRLADVIFLSNWPLFVFALPLILGYKFALELDFLPTLLFLGGILFLALFSSQMGVIVALVASRLWGNLRNKFLGMFLLIAIPPLAIGLTRIILPLEFLNNLGTLSIEEIIQLINRQALMAKFLPTTWLVNLIHFYQTNPSLSIRSLFFLVFSYLAVSLLLLLLRGKFYFQAVNKTAEGRFIAAPWDIVKKNPRSFPYLIKGRMGALTEKDWLVIFRSPSQLFQVGFIIFLGIVYFLIISRIPLERFQQVFPGWYQEELAKFNFLFISYLIAVFALRFVFPMISLEGQSSWIVWSAPLIRMKIFWQKLISSFLLILAWAEISTFFSIKILGLPLSQQWPLFLINLPLALTITAIALGIGAIKPNFWERNPEKLSTSPGGILATAVCLGYIGMVCLLLFIPERGLFFLPLIHSAVWLISALIVVPILIQVARVINQYEI